MGVGVIAQAKRTPPSFGVQESISLYPTGVTATGWAGVSNILRQQLDEDSLYQRFSRSSAAYIPSEDEESSEPTSFNAFDVVDDDTSPVNVGGESVDSSDENVIVGTTTDSATDDVPPQENLPPELDNPPADTSEPIASTTAKLIQPITVFGAFAQLRGDFQYMQLSTTSPQAPSSTDPAAENIEVETETVAPEIQTEALPTGNEAIEEATSTESNVISSTTPETTSPVTQNNATNTATPVVVATSSIDEAPHNSQTNVEPVLSRDDYDSDYVMTVRDFGVPELTEGQFITGAQLRLSLAAQLTEMASGSENYFEIVYRSPDYVETIGIITIDNEISNAINGGYYLFALPEGIIETNFEGAELDIVFYGDADDLDGAYIDSVWFEVNTKVFTRADLNERVRQGLYKKLKQPGINEFVSEQIDFKRSELPRFNLRYKSQRNVAVRFVRELFGRDVAKIEKARVIHGGLSDLGINPKITTTKEGLITIEIPEEEKVKMKPGRYTIELTISEGGKTYTDSFDFQWGILAINPDQTEYVVGEPSFISIGALTPNGNTLCNANLWLYIIDPDGLVETTPVRESGQCNGNNVIDVPDYSASYMPIKEGIYEMYLERVDDDGDIIGHTSDTFMVVNDHALSISRVGPTRIYPPAPYPMELTVTANESFTGTLTELVPKSFTVFNTDATITEVGEYQQLKWEVSLLAGDQETLTYYFDAPDISPYLFNVGPAELVKAKGSNKQLAASSSATSSPNLSSNKGFVEHREWQIASDAAGRMVLLWDDGGSIPADWNCLSCGDVFTNQFLIGSSTASTTGGNTTTSHTASASVLTSSDPGVSESGKVDNIAPDTHGHSLSIAIGGAVTIPEYRTLRVIEYTLNAGEPMTDLPAGAIGIFDVASSSLPTGWVRYAAQDGRYVLGSNTPGTTGGTNVHQHTATGTTSGGSGTAERNRPSSDVESALLTHTHTVDATTDTVSNEPPYIEVLLAELQSDASSPNGLIAMWTNDAPSGWINLSDEPGDPFTNRFIKASTTYGATGGSFSHTHGTSTVQTQNTANTDTVRDGSDGAPANHSHDVNLSDYSTDVHLPPYITVVFGKRFGTNPIYNQTSFRWFANDNNLLPTDPWPSGVSDLAEGENITSASTPVLTGDRLRLRMNAGVTNATSSSGSTFVLQYAAATTCSVAGTWLDVGDTSSSTALWRGYDNTLSDHAALSSNTLASTTVLQTYEENGYATSTPNDTGVDDIAEWDFVLENNAAEPGTNYCFRMIEEDGTAFSTYTTYPQLFTNAAPSTTLSKLFDNEKTASTSPWFQFVATDEEGEDVHYQVQVDDDYNFGSTVVDESTIADPGPFENQFDDTNKAPFREGETIEFQSEATLNNGTTYYWRVRARDSDGSDTWGGWSAIRSFTIDTSLTATAWYQTQDEQFETNTLSGVEAGSDQASLLSGSTTGSMIGTAIDFTDGELGTAWSQLLFSDSEGTGDITYQIQYLTDASTWSLIPDVDLSGNSSGFDASPVSLLDLDTDTYETIRVVANYSNPGTPDVNDWTVEWGFRVETPSISKLFPNEKVGTTTPTFEFVTTDPQSDSLTYQISWSTDNTFVTGSTTRTSDATPPTGFVNIGNQGDSDPFDSGETIQFTVQPADALTDSATYWWRVRAKDTTGDDVYSFWTDPLSFTVDSSVTVSTWFQTTEEQFDTDVLSGTVALSADEVSVATTASEAIIVYGQSTESAPRYRLWNGSEWGSENTMQTIGAPLRWAVVKPAPTRQEYVAATAGTDNDVNAQVYSMGDWGDLQEMTATMGNVNARGFDVAYETVSGRALVVYCDGDADPSYYIWNGTAWNLGTSTINLGSTNTCEWIKLASDPTTNEIVLMSRDSAGTGAASYEVEVWNGSSWTDGTVTLGGARNAAYETMALAYEDSGNQAIAISGDSNPVRFEYNLWNAGWAGSANNNTISDNLIWAELVPDSGTDAMTMCYVDESVNIGAIRWTGSGWTGQIDLDTPGNNIADRSVSCVYETTAGRDGNVLAVYSDTTSPQWRAWTGASWSTASSVRNMSSPVATIQTRRTGDGTILAGFYDHGNDRIDFSAWDGSSWSEVVTLETDAPVASSPYGEPFMMAPRSPGTEGTTIVSPGINFTDGLGPRWDEFSWVDSTPGSSDILYSVQYYDGDSWEFIPDSEISGNESGFTTSPVNLSNLDISTYSQIRPYAALSCQDSATCPTLEDWTVEWEPGITVSGTIYDYDRTTPVAGGTVAVAVNDTLQVGKVGSISGGNWSITNVTAFPGDVITVFVSEAASANEAVVVEKYEGTGDMTGLPMYERHLVLNASSSTSTTNALLSLYDNTNDEDIFYNSDGSYLRMCADTGCGDARLYVATSTIYSAGGRVSTHDLINSGTFIATTTVYVSGSWDDNGTSTLTSSTVIFNATSSSETLDSTGAITSGFNNLTFGTTTGNATWTPAALLDVNGNLNVTRGTLSRDAIPIAIAGSLTTGANGVWSGVGTTTFDGSGGNTWRDLNATLQNVGNVVVDGSSKTITLASNVSADSVSIGGNDTLDVSGSHYDIDVYGNWTNGGAFVDRLGEVDFVGSSAGQQITTGGDNFYDLTFSGSGDWTLVDSDNTIANNLTISNGTLSLPSGTTTVAGSFDSTGGTFAHGNGTILFTSPLAESITIDGAPFTNSFYNLTFDGTGSWNITDTHATTSHDLRVLGGAATFPTGVLQVGGSLFDSGGSFNANGGTVEFTSSGAEAILAGGSSFANLTTSGSGSWTISDTTVTATDDLIITGGTLTLASATTSIGGSLVNSATLNANSGVVLFNSNDTGEIVSLGNSSLYDVAFNNSTGGWTINAHATATNDVSLKSVSDFTLSSSQVLSVGGAFTNNAIGASTTWTGSTLSLAAGNYSINDKSDSGDIYGTLLLDGSADIAMWNSSANSYNIASGGSLYSQDHTGTDGSLYIYGEYERSSGTEHWSNETDFDGADLSGGSERQANVRLASGATVSLIDSTLSVVGATTSTTTVQNQSSGTYTVSITGGTTSAQYYDFDNLGATGLSLLGNTVVTSLSDGAFEPGVGGATGLTVSSTTIDTNPGLQIFRVNFATTSAIAATNVTQTIGTPTSFWWFRNGTGNLYGEQFDLDPDAGGNPGTVRWDDSALSVTISGTIFTNDGDDPLTGGTCNGVLEPVTVVVEGVSAPETGSCGLLTGDFSIPISIIGDPTITVFLDDAFGGENAVVVTKTVTGDVTDMNLYENRVIVRHEDTDPMTIEDMATYDSSDDDDVRFSVATGTVDTLSVFAGNELHVWATTTFTPGGNVSLGANASGDAWDGSLHLENGSTFTGAGTSTYTIGGSITMETGTTFTPALSTVVMAATTTGKTINVAPDSVFNVNQLNFTGVSGGWNLNGDVTATADINMATGTLTGTGDVTLTGGSFYGDGLVSLGSGVVSIATANTLGGTQGWTFAHLTLGNGSVVGTTTPGSAATTTVSGTLTIDTAHFLDAGSSIWNLSGVGSVFVENGTFREDTSTVRYSGTGATNILSTDYYNLELEAFAGSPTYTAVGSGIQAFNDFSVGESATTSVTFDTNDSALNVDGDFTIGPLGTFVASDSGSFTIAGSYDNDGTFTSSGGTVTFDGGGTPIISAGNSSFATAVIDGAGDFLVLESATATDAFTLDNANTFQMGSFEALAVGGTFTNDIGGAATFWTNSTLYLYGGGNYSINDASVSDNYHALTVGPNTQIRMWNSDASSTTVSSTASLYSQDHSGTDGDLYVYGAYENTSDTDYWSYATDFDGADLSGGGERKVDVYVSSGSSITYSNNAVLSVLGASTASTSVQNQGSGAYSFAIAGGASTTLNYYELSDMDAVGLTFSGSPDVANISRGYYEVGNDNYSAITVGGSVISANPALTFTRNIFATSSGVASAVNVTATGTTVSSWRFTNHRGDIDGEDFDDDPDGNPGYIVWDNSSSSITISGNVYSDEGSTTSTVCDSLTTNITLVVAGLTSTSTTCDGDGAGGGTGAYSISGITFSDDDSIVVFIDEEAANGATVAFDPVSNIPNLDIYEDRVIVRHESPTAISIDDMTDWDSSDEPGDIPFTAVSGSPDTLTLAADTKLIVWDNKEFAPDGNVTLSSAGSETYRGDLELQDDATFTAAGSEVHTIGGSLISGSGATFTAGNSTTTFTAATAETININDASFYNLSFTGSGSWSMTDTILDANHISITGGTLTLPTGTTTVSGFFNNNGGVFNYNGSPLVFDGSGSNQTVAFGGSDAGSLTFSGSGSWDMTDTNATSTGGVTVGSGTLVLNSGTLAANGDFRNTGGNITHNTGELRLTGTSTELLANGSDLYSVTFTGTGAHEIEDFVLTLLGNLDVLAGDVALPAGTPTSTLSIGGSLLATNGTFESATGTVTFNSSDTGEIIAPGSSAFYNIIFQNGSGGWTMAGNATATNNFVLNTANTYTQQSGTTLYVGNVFDNSVGGSATTWQGSTLILNSGSEFEINTSLDSGDAYDTLTIGPNTDVSTWYSSATTTNVATGASWYSQDHSVIDGALNIYGDYHIATTTEYWSYATDFDGADLSGGSERSVTVSIAENATTTLSGATLNIVGASGNETTIQNQGVGNYDFNVTGGTLNAQYYQFRNLNGRGLDLSGTPTITALDYGDFELAVDSGTLISLSSTTLNANASLVITGARFATTTAISGNNVTLYGSTASAWTFTSHTGNLAGENYDVDGGSNCGSVRWGDSSCLITQQTHFRWRYDDGGIGVPDSEWYHSNWSKRQSVRIINNDATTYTNSVIQLTVAHDGDDMKADFEDLRFTDADGTTLIDHFIASTSNNASAEVWVEVPSLPSSDTAVIFMYYGNGSATTTSSSSATFAFVDDFEDGDIAEYSGSGADLSEFTVDGTYAYGGSTFGLDNTGQENDKTDDGIANFNVTVSQGQTLRYQQYFGNGSVDEACTLFGVQSPVSSNENYAVCLEQYNGDRVSIVEDVVDTDSSGTLLSSTTDGSITFTEGIYTVEIDWGTDDDIDVTVYDESGAIFATVSANSGTYTSGGVGFTYWVHYGGWDNYTARPLVETEPTIRFGAESVSGGATWASALDTQSTVFTIGDVARLRIAVENSGLAVADTYRLEFAELGAAPSCAAVSGASFDTVAPAASCGADPVCMATSTEVVNGASTTDLIYEADGDYVLGEFVEDTSNITGVLSVDQDEYTEIEYAVKVNSELEDQNLCFRISDAGAALDTYLRVARMSVPFDPSFGAVTLNNGEIITLEMGTTTRVYATSTVTDLNGSGDLVSGTSTIYRSGAGAACSADNNSCYISGGEPQCSLSGCAGNSCTLSCYADIYYHADPTDSGAYEGQEWLAYLEVIDQAGGTGLGSAMGVELMTLRAIDVSESIDYGSLTVSADTGSYNATTTIENLGNDYLDVQISSTDLSDGESSTIPATQQIFATSTFNYSTCVFCTSATSTGVNYELDLGKPATTSPAITDDVYWGIEIPFGVASNPHSGVLGFMAIGD